MKQKEMRTMITILNTSILTAYGSYEYKAESLEEVKMLLNVNGWQSAVGHQATADVLSDLFERPVTMNRIQYAQRPGETAIVFKLKGRPPEGVVLSREEVGAMGYELGTLTRIK
jgi:hypothetical protein